MNRHQKQVHVQRKEQERVFDPLLPLDEEEVYSDNRYTWRDFPGLDEFARSQGLDPEMNYEDVRNGQIRSCLSMALFFRNVSPEMRAISMNFHSPTTSSPRPANRSWSGA